MNSTRDTERRHWYINGAVLLFLFVQLVFIAVLIGEIHDQDIEMAQMKRQHMAEMQQMADTPYADAAWLTAEVKRLQNEVARLEERITLNDN